MTSAAAFVRRHPVTTYFALTYAISWGGFVFVAGPGSFPGTGSQFDALLPFVAAAMLAGPAVAGLLLTVLLSGTAGLRELLSRLFRWRVGARWYVAALLPAPLLSAAVLFALSLTSPIFTAHDKTAILLTGITAGLTTVLEEVGWTGFATPMLRRRHGVVTTGLIVGVMWGAWHLLQGLWIGGTYAGSLPVAAYVASSFVIGIAQLTAYRVLMLWVYDRTDSLLVATLMHASLTASIVFVFAPAATGATSLIYGCILAGAMWAVVAAVAWAGSGIKPTKAFIEKHPVLTYYALVFAISWGGILMLVAPGGIPGKPEDVARLFPFVLAALFAGPSVAGLVMTALVSGRAGFRELLARLGRWRVGAAWWAAAILTGPVLVAAVLFGLSRYSPDFVPGLLTTDDKLGLLIFGLAWGLVGGGLLEELGWTGFAVPTLRRRYSALATGLIVGVLWGAWHLLIAVWASRGLAGEASVTGFVAGFLAFYFVALSAYRVLMVWMYDQTGSLLLAMIMHAVLSASTLVLQPASADGQFTWNLLLGAVLWVVVAVIGLTRAPVVMPRHREN